MPLPDGLDLVALLEAQAARTPGGVAVVCGSRQLTYAESIARANQFARELRMHGVGPDVLVGLCLERSCEMVVALLGVLKSGGAYVPLDPAYPADRLAFMLDDAAAAVVIAESRQTAVAPPGARGNTVCAG